MRDSSFKKVLLDPKSVPFRGQVSSLDAASADPSSGYVAQSVNFRWDGNKATVRYGMVSDKAAPVANGTFLGELRNSLGEWIAVADGGSTKIYQWDTAGGTWREISDATTRFTSTTLPVTFSIATVRVFPGVAGFSDTNNAYIVWQNGVELPRIRNAASNFSGTYTSKVHLRFDDPYPAASRCQPRPLNYFNTQSVTARTNDGGGTASSASTSYSGGGAYETVTFTTSASTSSWAKVQYTGAIALSSAPSQLHIVFKSSDAFIFSRVRVSIFTGSGGTPASTEYVVYDPSTNSQALSIVEIDDVYSMAVFSLDTVYNTSLSVITTGFPATQVDAIKFNWRDSAPAATTTLNVYYVGFGAGVRWGTEVKCAYWGDMSRAESRGVLCQTVEPPLLKEVGGTPIPNLRLAKSTVVRYRLTAYSTKREGLNSDATDIIWYIRTPGSLDFYQIDASPTSLTGYSSRDWVTHNIESEDVIPRIAPTEFYESIPIGSCMLALGDRLVVGNARPSDGSSVSSGNSEVWFSKAKYPWRFSQVVDTSETGEVFPDSAVTVSLDNTEVMRLVTISSANLGADPVIIFTTDGVYSADGSDASSYGRPFRTSPYGTRAPYSVAVDAGMIFYMDTFRQVRTIMGRADKGVVSRGVVDDKLSGIPDARISKVSGAIHEDKYYLAFTPNGASYNEQILIYDFRIQGWYTDSTASTTVFFERLRAVEENSKRKLFFIGRQGTTYQHENSSATTDSGTAITARIRFLEVTEGFEKQVVIEDIVACADVTSSQKYITTRRYPRTKTDTPNSGRIDLYNGTSGLTQVVRFDRDAGNAAAKPLTVPDMGVSVDIETDAPPGTSIYAIYAYGRVNNVGPDKQ